MYSFESVTDLRFLNKVAVRTNWLTASTFTSQQNGRIYFICSQTGIVQQFWDVPLNSIPQFFFNDFVFGFPITNDAPFCSPKNQVIPAHPHPHPLKNGSIQTSSQGRSVPEIKKHGGGNLQRTLNRVQKKRDLKQAVMCILRRAWAVCLDTRLPGI